jgi:hypothetical protein
VQDTEAGYQTSGDANAVISVLVFRFYFVCGVNWVAPELDVSDFAIFETDIQRGGPEIFDLLNITRYRLAIFELPCKVEQSKKISLAGE